MVSRTDHRNGRSYSIGDDPPVSDNTPAITEELRRLGDQAEAQQRIVRGLEAQLQDAQALERQLQDDLRDAMQAWAMGNKVQRDRP